MYRWILGISILIFLGHYFLAGQAVYGDGIGYYAHLHTWVFDRDLDFTNEYRHIYSPANNNLVAPRTSPVTQIVSDLPTGRAGNFYSPGPAALLLPFYLAAHLLALFFSLPANGYSDIYQIFVGVGGVVYSVVALMLLERLLLKLNFSSQIAKNVVLVMFFASHLLYYLAYDVINSHFASFLVVILFWNLAISKKIRFRSGLMGLFAGLAALVRPQDGILILFGLFWISNGKVLYFTTVFTSLLSWIITTQAVFGSILSHPYFNQLGQPIRGGVASYFTGSLINWRTGLLSKSPVLLVPIGFFLVNLKRNWHPVYWWTLAFFLVEMVIITLQQGWSAAAYGGRMYTSSLVFFALVLAEFFRFVRSRYSMKVVYVIVFTFSLINIFQVSRFLLFDKGTASGGFGVEEGTRQRLERLVP